MYSLVLNVHSTTYLFTCPIVSGWSVRRARRTEVHIIVYTIVHTKQNKGSGSMENWPCIL